MHPAERCGGLRDTQGVLWVMPEQWGELARALACTEAHVGRMAERAAKRWKALPVECEVFRVSQILGTAGKLMAERLSQKGAMVAVEVRNCMLYKIGEEIVARRGKWSVWTSEDGR